MVARTPRQLRLAVGSARFADRFARVVALQDRLAKAQCLSDTPNAGGSGHFTPENPPAHAGKMRFDSVLFRRAAVRAS
jgi:hypothetical protein